MKVLKRIVYKILVFIYGFGINFISFFSTNIAAKITFKVFKKPRGGKLKKSQSDYLHQELDGYFEVNNDKIAYYRWPSNGQKILLIHGWESSSVRWKPYLSTLIDKGFDVYALDAPAHGLSSGKYFTPQLYADAIAHLVEKFNISILLGHSVGAYSALIYAHSKERSSSLKHLLLMAPTGNMVKFMDRFFKLLGLRDTIKEQYYKNLKSEYLEEPEYFNSYNLIKNIQLKGLLIHDINDNTLPFSDSLLIAENWPKGTFIQTEGFGHRLKSTEVKNAIFNYLDQVS